MNTSIREDRTFGGDKPYIDLTPAALWGKPTIMHLGKPIWEQIEMHVARRVNYACELCSSSKSVRGVMGKHAYKFGTELRFEQDRQSKVATLKRLMHVCALCSQAIHLRRTELMSEGKPSIRNQMVGAIARLSKFHDMNEAQVRNWLAKERVTFDHDRTVGYPAQVKMDIVENWTTSLWR